MTCFPEWNTSMLECSFGKVLMEPIFDTNLLKIENLGPDLGLSYCRIEKISPIPLPKWKEDWYEFDN